MNELDKLKDEESLESKNLELIPAPKKTEFRNCLFASNCFLYSSTVFIFARFCFGSKSILIS